MKNKFIWIFIVAGVLLVSAKLYFYHTAPPTEPLEEEVYSENEDSPLSDEMEDSQTSLQNTDEQEEITSLNPSQDTLDMTLGELESLMKSTLKTLPTISDLEDLSDEEVHQTPEILNQAASKIAQIESTLENHPEWLNEGARFYKSCFIQEETPLPIRTVCFRYFKRWNSLKEKPENIDDLKLPEELKNISDFIDSAS